MNVAGKEPGAQRDGVSTHEQEDVTIETAITIVD